MEDFKFSTLEYKRPDFEKTGAFAEEITEKIKNVICTVTDRRPGCQLFLRIYNLICSWI